MRGRCVGTCVFHPRQLSPFHPLSTTYAISEPRPSAIPSHGGQRSRVKFARAGSLGTGLYLGTRHHGSRNILVYSSDYSLKILHSFLLAINPNLFLVKFPQVDPGPVSWAVPRYAQTFLWRHVISTCRIWAEWTYTITGNRNIGFRAIAVCRLDKITDAYSKCSRKTRGCGNHVRTIISFCVSTCSLSVFIVVHISQRYRHFHSHVLLTLPILCS